MIEKIDLLIAQNGYLELIDFKTQRKPNSSDILIDVCTRQLFLYAFILRERHEKPVQKMYIYWTGEEKRNDALYEVTYSDDRVEKAGRFFDDIVSRIKSEKYNITITNHPDKEKVCKECDLGSSVLQMA
jgi:DNA helicase-2/ATP-dependent DNA helicase PcrA